MVPDGTIVVAGSVRGMLVGMGGPSVVIVFLLKSVGLNSVSRIVDGK